MKTILYYAAANTFGSSANIVKQLKEQLKQSVDCKNVLEDSSTNGILNYDLLVFLVATYGDQELQDNIERFLVSINSDLKGKKFAICELGNYYGYDDYLFGAGQVVESYLTSKNATKHLRTFSIDSLPKLDLISVQNWINHLGRSLEV